MFVHATIIASTDSEQRTFCYIYSSLLLTENDDDT